MKIISRILGSTRVILSVFWLCFLVGVLVYGVRGFNWIGENVDKVFKGASNNLSVISTLLDEVTDVIDNVEVSFGTVEKTLIDAGLTLDDSRPMVDKSSNIITQDVPTALEEIQETMPGVIEAAGLVDKSLLFLSMFQFTVPNPFGADWDFNLGLDYNPEIPFEDAIVQMSSTLDGLPEQMRAVESDLDTVDINMSLMSDDLIDIASDLDSMRAQIADINPELDKIIQSLDDAQVSVDGLADDVPVTLDIAQKVFIGLVVLLILGQIPSAYFGYLVASEGSKPLLDETPELNVEKINNN